MQKQNHKHKQLTYLQLEKIHEEMSDYIHNLNQDMENLSNERQYLSDYIEWKGLTDDYEYFKAHAHKTHLDKDLPFENYVL